MNSLKVSSKLLVIARSARMLAQMAVDAGFAVVAIDCFADADTRQIVLDVVKVSSLGVGDVSPALEAMRKAHGLTYVVYGSGFEDCTETLVFLEKNWVVLGNLASVYRLFQDKQKFFNHLDELSIRHPETAFNSPGHGDSWLVKPMRGEGGGKIVYYDPDSDVTQVDCYWQRVQEGETLSVLFVACQGAARVLGFNRQWVVGGGRSFVFAGVSNHAQVSPQNQALMSEWLAKLLRVYPLQGLGSLDFIVHNHHCYMLEINARIPASAQLYGSSVFNLHCQACLGQLGDVEPAQPSAYQVVFASKDTLIPIGLRWPEWVVDRPVDGSFIGQGQPVCSIIAAGKSAEQVEARLRRKLKFIEHFLKIGL